MSHDLSIRRMTIAEQADAAAKRTAETGVLEANPHEGTPDGPAWKAAYQRQLLRHSAPESSARSA